MSKSEDFEFPDWVKEHTSRASGQESRTIFDEMSEIQLAMTVLPTYVQPLSAAQWFRAIRLAAQRAERALKTRTKENLSS